MGNRGPKPTAAMAIQPPAVNITTAPDAPYSLTDEQAEIWRQVIAAVPPGWFTPENFSLLEAYTRHVVSSRRVAMLVGTMEDKDTGVEFDIELYDRLLKMQERESRALASLATKMRISQQAVIDKRTSRATKGRQPWNA